MELDAICYVWGKGYDIIANIDAIDFIEYKRINGKFTNDDVLLGFKEDDKMPTNISIYASSIGTYYDTVWHCKYIKNKNKYETERYESNKKLIDLDEYQTWTYSLTKPYKYVNNNTTYYYPRRNGYYSTYDDYNYADLYGAV